MNTLNLQNKLLEIGSIFTPHHWCKYFINKFDILSAWLEGKTLLDPTMGTGNILEALVDYALEQGYSLKELPLHNLFGVEINNNFYSSALKKFKKKYSFNMLSNFRNSDIFNCNEFKCDILFGNPPWSTFNAINEGYKEYIKPLFFKYGLVESPKELLLGNSRIDVSALVIQKTLTDNLNPQGRAIFFIPLSLLFNPGANAAFRKFYTKKTYYKLESIYDLNSLNVFPNVMTRYGLICIRKGQKNHYPISCLRYKDHQWIDFQVQPLQKCGDPLVTVEDKNINFQKIKIPESARPRQGINTCGANDLFFFNSYEPLDETFCRVSGEIVLPQEFVFPLITSKNFKNQTQPYRWVMLPYNKLRGKPLSPDEIEKFPSMWQYLQNNKERLMSRKGTMLNSYMKSGHWWAMLGVGAYSFVPYKVTWEAFGKKEFKPQIFEGRWQANQSLQAFIPCSDIIMAKSVLASLKNPAVESYLHSFNMQGTMNWAQPGKMRHLFSFVQSPNPISKQLSLFNS